jgi:predicted esterase
LAVQPTVSGHPVVVFLHGWGRLGSDYYRIAHELAEMGIIAVMMNTGQHSYAVLERDARAMFEVLGTLSTQLDGFWEGAIDTSRVGLLGHSMGAAVISLVLNEGRNQLLTNPGYVCGLGLAPVNPAIVCSGSEVHVPFGLVSGRGDLLTPPPAHAIPYYNSLVPTEGLKFHYQLNANCTHMNLVGLAPNNPEIFARSRKICRGFFGQFLVGSLSGLEAILGVDGQADPNLVVVDVDSAVPQSWAADEMRVGSLTRVSVAAEAGYAGLIVASSMGLPTNTVIGTLLLDSSTAFSVGETVIAGERLDVMIYIPLLPEMIGVEFAVQGAGATISTSLSLGSALCFTIGS